MSRIECTECHDLIDTIARTVVLPFVCDECQKAPELLEAMAPAGLKIEDADNVACDCTPADEATNLLIEDLQNQLDITKNEAEILRNTMTILEGQVETLAKQAETLGIEKVRLSQETFKAFFESFMVKIVNSKLVSDNKELYRELQFAAKRLFELAAENGTLQSQITLLDKAGKALGKLYEDSQDELDIAYKARDVGQKRAEIAKRAYDRASADRRYYRGKCKEAGIV